MTTPLFYFPKTTYNPTTADSLPTLWVQDENTLYQLIDEIDSVDMVALDTEFVRRTTYYPILALVQVNTGKAIYLVDAPRLDLTEFWQALAEVPSMIWYACGEDLTIFYHLANCPPLTNIFDVQIGVAYLTNKMQVGYAQAVSEILGISLDKAESQSNWLTRPLSEQQIHYASDDVRYLLDLYHVIKKHLDDRVLGDYVAEDSVSYAHEIYTAFHTPHNLLYLDSIDPSYNRRQITLLCELMTWREDLAKATNQPRSFIINKQPLREIITDMPTNLKQLAHTTLNRSALRRYGDDIVRIIKQVKALPDDALIALPPPTYTSKDKPFKKELNHAIATHSQTCQIPESLLMRGRWLNQLLYMIHQDLDETHLPTGLTGYRKAWVLDTILPLLGNYKAKIDDGFLCTTYR